MPPRIATANTAPSLLDAYWAIPKFTRFLATGAVSTADTWNYNIKAIADSGFHVVALDLPGFGGSDKPNLQYKVEDFVLYLDGFMTGKGIETAALPMVPSVNAGNHQTRPLRRRCRPQTITLAELWAVAASGGCPPAMSA